MDETKFKRVWYLKSEPESKKDAVAIVQTDSQYGLANSDGELLATFDNVDTFGNNGGFVKLGEKWGYIDRQGKWVIEPKYDQAWDLTYPENDRKALAIVRIEEQLSLINRKGETLVEFDDVAAFNDDYGGFVQKGDKWGYIDPMGQWIIKPQFDDTRKFHNGRAFVKIDGRTGIIDRQGQWVIEPGTVLKPKKDRTGKYGYVDDKDRWIIEPQFDEAGNIRHPETYGFAKVSINGKRGYVMSDGEYLVKPLFDDIGEGWMDGCLLVKENGKWGYVKRDYSWLFESQFDEADDFYRGLALVKCKDRYGYVKTDGTYLVEPRFDKAFYFQFYSYYGEEKGTGIATVREADLWGFLGTDGRWIMEPQFDEVVISTDIVGGGRPYVYRDGGSGHLYRDENGRFYIEGEKEPTSDNNKSTLNL